MFNDDEKPAAPVSDKERLAAGFSEAVKASTKVEHRKDAPLAATTVSVLLEVTGSSSAVVGRAPLDLVVVLDVSGSMEGSRMGQLQSAMHFVILKLGSMDRLCIITFANAAARHCPLRIMSDAVKSDLGSIVDHLVAGGGTNIEAGLETGICVLDQRQYTAGRTANILLMSDGHQNHGDARRVNFRHRIPIYSISFGYQADMNLLQDLAVNGGTFYLISDSGFGGTDMLTSFSQLMAGLLTVVVQDLYLMLSPPTGTDVGLDKIVNVAPGDYSQETDGPSGTVTVKLGNLFGAEGRKVVVDVLLREASRSYQEDDIPDVDISYADARGIRQTVRGPTLRLTRSAAAVSVVTTPRLHAEKVRRQHADSIKTARLLADTENLDDARDTLTDAHFALEDITVQANLKVAMLRAELQQLLDRMESLEIYDTEGRPCALAAETSDARQRFATRGNVEEVRLFATPRMDTYLKQALQFAKDSQVPLPTADDDAAEVVKPNSAAAVAGSVGFYIHAAVEALLAMEKILTAAAAAENV